MMEIPSLPATVSATANVPLLQASISNMPIGPFHKTVFAEATTSLKRAMLFGPMSTPSQPSSILPSKYLESLNEPAPKSKSFTARLSKGKINRTPLAFAFSKAAFAVST